MSDLVFDLDPETGLCDLVFRDATLATGDDLTTPALVSLFTDARAKADDPLPAPGDTDRRGCWGDAFPAAVTGAVPEQDRIGSRLWLLERELQTPETLARARLYAAEALAWMVSDGICRAVEVDASFPQPGWLQIDIDVERLDGSRFAAAWSINWEAQILRPAVSGWLN